MRARYALLKLSKCSSSSPHPIISPHVTASLLPIFPWLHSANLIPEQLDDLLSLLEPTDSVLVIAQSSSSKDTWRVVAAVMLHTLGGMNLRSCVVIMPVGRVVMKTTDQV